MNGVSSLIIATIVIILVLVGVVYLASTTGSLTPAYQYIP